MIRLFTVVEKETVLAMLQHSRLPEFINNIGYSKSCCKTICSTADDCYMSLGCILPCIVCDNSEFAEALTERFPLNWKTHMYLQLDVDEDRVFHLQHSTLLELSALPEPCTTEETIQYQAILLNAITNEFALGASSNAGDINFLVGLQCEDLTGFMILDEDFDPHEDTSASMSTNVSGNDLQNAIKSSVFSA